MSDSDAQIRKQLESKLMETLRQRQQEWATASEDRRDLARQRFINALHDFNSLVLYGKDPRTSGINGALAEAAD